MIGWSVTSSSASGLRVTPIRLRFASAVLWRTRRVIRAPPWAWQVSEKKTSSRLGRWSESSVTAMPAAFRRSTAAVSASSPATGTATVPRAGKTGSAVPISAIRFVGLLEAVGVGRADGQRLAADDPLEAGRRVVGDHLAVVDDGDLVGERVGLLQVLRGEEDRRAVVDEVAHDAPHVLALGGVQAGRGLVQEDDARAADEAGGEVEAAAHAARVRAGGTVRGVLEVEPLEQLGGALAARPCA